MIGLFNNVSSIIEYVEKCALHFAQFQLYQAVQFIDSCVDILLLCLDEYLVDRMWLIDYLTVTLEQLAILISFL